VARDRIGGRRATSPVKIRIETMRTTNLHWISALSIVAALTACPAEENADGTGDGASTGGTDDQSASSTMSASETSATMSASTTTATTATTEDTESESETEPGTISVTMTSPTGEDPLPNGAMCEENEQCESMMCFVVGPLGGICGDCLSDADCADTTGGGCSIPNPLSTPPQGAECNMGQQGEGCMSDAVCVDGGLCAVILDVPGILTASTCGECLTDAECTDGALCSPSYDVAELSGVKACVAPGSVPDGEGCDLLSGTGNDACMSGFCQPADVLGVIELGVCSGCATDDDCTEPEVCLPPEVVVATGLVAGGCGMMP